MIEQVGEKSAVTHRQGVSLCVRFQDHKATHGVGHLATRHYTTTIRACASNTFRCVTAAIKFRLPMMEIPKAVLSQCAKLVRG